MDTNTISSGVALSGEASKIITTKFAASVPTPSSGNKSTNVLGDSKDYRATNLEKARDEKKRKREENSNDSKNPQKVAKIEEKTLVSLDVLPGDTMYNIATTALSNDNTQAGSDSPIREANDEVETNSIITTNTTLVAMRNAGKFLLASLCVVSLSSLGRVGGAWILSDKKSEEKPEHKWTQ